MRGRIELRTVLILAVMLPAALVTESCATKQSTVPVTPKSESAATVVLLVDEGGTQGSLEVSNAAGTRELTEAATAVEVRGAGVSPNDPFPITQAEIDARFGPALSMLPEAEESFAFYFLTGGDALTPESEALLPRLFAAIARRASPELTITGHTDSTGTAQSNYELGLRRAERLATILRERGVRDDLMTVESHGESNQLVSTADGVAEPRNRRVEVIVR